MHALYGEGKKVDRHRAYADQMRVLSEGYSHDLDAAAFYALVLLGTRAG